MKFGMSDRIERLLQRAAALDQEGGISRRREELIQRVTDAGHPREYADQLYDVASEEGVDPAAALELVLCGVGVRDLGGPTPDQSWDEAQVEAPPTWLNDTAPTPDEAARERQTRASFRRLRSMLERAPSTEAAIREFVKQPDVGEIEY